MDIIVSGIRHFFICFVFQTQNDIVSYMVCIFSMFDMQPLLLQANYHATKL